MKYFLNMSHIMTILEFRYKCPAYVLTRLNMDRLVRAYTAHPDSIGSGTGSCVTGR